MNYSSLQAYERDIIDNATRFDVAIFLGTGQYGRTENLPDLATARARASEMKAEANNGRGAMVYAISTEGRSVLVPAAYKPNPKPEKTEMPNNVSMSGVDIAKLTAAVVGGAYKRANSKEAAIKRFKTVAIEKGISNADAILRMPFDQARNAIAGNDAPAKQKPAAKAAAKPAAAKTATPKADRPTAGKRAAAIEAAKNGKMPEPPDFSAKTHERFRGKLAEIVELAKAEDIKALKAFKINPVSSSPKAMDRYRNLCVVALEARAAK